ncbi:MAG: transposase [Chlorobi bacterium]|nr:transposase [Chlorobiota bacterium]
MKKSRRKFSAEVKTKVVLEALSERMTATELAQKYEIHPNQIALWKREFLDHAADVFKSGKQEQQEQQQSQEDIARLYRKIGQLQVENDFLKKNLLS